MNKKITTNMGPYLKNIRSSRKISRKDLSHICHPNTLRNFEVGFNQINIDDFTKILIELGHTNYDINDSLETIETKQYEEYIQLSSEYDFFQVQCNRRSIKTSDQAVQLYNLFQKYLEKEAFQKLELVFQQDVYAKYLVLANYLETSEISMFQHGLEMFYMSYHKGQKNYSQGEIALMSALCVVPCKKENAFYKLCDKICEVLLSGPRLRVADYEFLYNYIELLHIENYRKFNTLRTKISEKNQKVASIFYDVKKT